MLKFIRKRQQGIMIVVAIAVIIAFAWFFNPYDARSGSLTATDAFRIGNKAVTLKEVERQNKLLRAASELGFTSLIFRLLGQNFDTAEFVQNRILLREQARDLGIEPTEEEVMEAIREHPTFQSAGAFDPDRYQDALKNTLEPLGLQPGDLRRLVADKIVLEKLEALLQANVRVPESQVGVSFQGTSEEIHAAVLDFKLADYQEGTEPTDEQIQNYYEEHKAEMISDEKRKIEWVFFEEPKRPTTTPTPVPPSTGATTPPIEIPPAPPIEIPPAPPAQSEGTEAPVEEPADETATPEVPDAPAPEEAEAESGEPNDAPAAESDSETADDESEPPGQAPDDVEETIPAPPVEPDGLEDLPSAEEIGDLTAPDLNEGITPETGAGLTGDDEVSLDIPPVPPLDLGGAVDGPPTTTMPPTAPTAPQANQAAANLAQHQENLKAFSLRVDAFYNKLLEKPASFAELAQEYGVELKTSEPFTQEDAPEEVPQEIVPDVFSVVDPKAAGGVMTPIEGLSPKGFYVVRILEVQEPQPLSLEEARPKIVEALKADEAKSRLETAVNEAREALTKALAEGKSFEEAVQELDLASRDLEAFTVRKGLPDEENGQAIVEAVQDTVTGEVSERQELGEDAFLVFVKKRVAAPTESTAEEGVDVAANGQTPPAPDPGKDYENAMNQMERSNRAMMFGLWLEEIRSEAAISRNEQVPPIPFNPFGSRRF